MKFGCILVLTVFRVVFSSPVKTAMVMEKNRDYDKNRPTVKVIKEGQFSKKSDGSMGMSSSVVYIHDGDECQIIVDSGVPSDTRTILRSLANDDILPTDITLVITTHYHPDHVGNQNLFGYATYIVSNQILDNENFKPMAEAMNMDPGNGDYEVRFVCPNVGLARVRGHTDDDNVVLVYNAEEYGNVSVTGDQFMCKEDIDDDQIWRKMSAYPDEQLKVRRMLVADSDYIIPGHGPMFKVTNDIRKRLADDQDDEPCSCAKNSKIKTMESYLSEASDAMKQAFSGDAGSPNFAAAMNSLMPANFSLPNATVLNATMAKLSVALANLTQSLGSAFANSQNAFSNFSLPSIGLPVDSSASAPKIVPLPAVVPSPTLTTANNATANG